MDADDVVAVARRAPAARVVAVHLDAINHCVQTRADLHQRLHDEGLTDRVTVPEDGAAVPVDVTMAGRDSGGVVERRRRCPQGTRARGPRPPAAGA